MIDLVVVARLAEQAAYAAGTHLRASRSRLTETLLTRRQPADVAREIRREGDALIREVVARHFPEHGFISDEDDSGFRDGQPHWVVDPLDGCDNYVRGHPQYAVSLALVTDGEPHVGVVYDPCRNEFFGALRGRGAVLNGMPIRCAPARSSQGALVATVFPRSTSPHMASHLAEVGRVARGFGRVRRSGSMALEMAYLAAGRIDAFWEHDLGSWNAAAGIVLLRESGALVESRDAEPLLLSRSLFACTPGLRGNFVDLLNPA